MPRLTLAGRLRPSSFVMLTAMAVIAAASAGCRSTPGQSGPAVTADTWAVVDGRQITRDDVEKAYRRTRDTTQTVSSEDELAAKLTLLNEMIVQDILVAKARELKVEVPDADLDKAYNDAKQNIPDEAFQQELTKRNLTPADMRDGLRRELLSQKVLEQEVRSKITVTDQEINDFFTANRAQFNVPEEAYHIAQIVVTPVREQQVGNRSGDDATTPQEAQAKAQMLMERLKGGASFRELAADFSEDPDSAPRGGDLGFVPVSRIKQAPPVMRDAVLNKAPGSVNVISTGGAHTIVLVIAHEQAGQRDLSSPGVKDKITEGLRGRREQLLRAAYLTALQSEAEVENHLARRVVESQGKVPTMAPAAPGAK
jgi:peptidyl-prolyl cis-trans isomerase SurA